MKTLNTISELQNQDPQEDMDVFVKGYYSAGDGGGGHYYWDPPSNKPVNQGTVIGSVHSSSGRWLLLDQDVGDFRTFGIFDNTIPADDALDALVNDAAFSQIYAYSDLLFQRRHRFTRSDITLDFQNHTLYTHGIEPTGPDDPFAAVMFFQGELVGSAITFTLTNTLPELTDIYPVGDSTQFKVGDWFAVEVKAIKGSAERELQKLVKVIAIIDPTHIQVGYANGWELQPGRVISWQKVEPVHQVTVQNLQFIGAGTDQLTGSHPVAFEYAIYANVQGIHSTGSFWPVVMRRWNTYYFTKQCSLMNPPNTAYGGAGYLTQQIYCLYGHVSDCNVANARHLNDFTGSAYCLVENCHANGQSAEKGPFVTHGQYEHDLTYTGNSGLMTFANSGATWGGSAKRINVRKQRCPWFVAQSSVSELTLEDVVVIADPAIPQSGMLWVNVDGLHMTGCTADRTLRISQVSRRSARKNVIQQCQFSLLDDKAPVVRVNVTSPIVFIDTVFKGINGHPFASTAPLSFVRCDFVGDVTSTPILLSSTQLTFDSCRIDGGLLTWQGSGAAQYNIFASLFTNSRLDFTAFNPATSSLIAVNNRLKSTAVVAQPVPADNVILQQNITLP